MASAMSPGGVRSQRYGSMGGPAFGYAQASINATAVTGGPGGMGLPLTIVSQIIQHLDGLDDVARFLRTSRLHYYMALPRLYEQVKLKSYAEVRRINGRVEGLGGASPICMALSALATSTAATVVKSLTLEGEWNEGDDYMVGRIPDATMLLSIAVRAAIDKMEALRSFHWNLDTKPMRTIYQGLNARSSLTHFILVFQSTRTPHPVTVIPAIPSLKSLKVFNLDPLCYNDDISILLRDSKKIEELQLHWNPRMRLEAECSTNLSTYFGKCMAANYMMPLKRVGFQNFYGPNHGQFVATLPQHSIVDSHFLDMFGGAQGRRTNVFVDETWRTIPPVLNFKWKIHRSNELSMQHTRILSGFRGLQELYLISKTIGGASPRAESTPPNASSPASPRSTTSTASSAANTPAVLPGKDLDVLKGEYFDAVFDRHGPTLQNLLIFNKFGWKKDEVEDIARKAPLLRQLGLGLDGGEEVFRDLIPLFPNLRALRVLENEFLEETALAGEENTRSLCEEFGRQIYRSENTGLRWIGLGDLVFEVEREPTEHEIRNGKGTEWRYELVPASAEDVQHIGIWKMDSLQLY